MKKIASLFSLVAVVGTGVTLFPACSASERTAGFANNPSPEASTPDETDAGDQDAEQIFTDAAPAKDAYNIFEASCATASAGTSTDPVTLEFVLDGSGSMSGDKWDAAVAALNAVFDDLKAKNDNKITVGMIVYSDTLDKTNSNGPYPEPNVDVYPQVVDDAHHTALANRINNSGAGGSTPTFAAISGGYNVLKNYTAIPPAPPADTSRKVLVLMSDGVPDGGTSEQAQCVNAAKNALNLPVPFGPIKTFAVGIGPFPGSAGDYDPKFMGDLAVAGGTRATPQCQPGATSVANVCHFQITPNGKPVSQIEQEFIAAINKIRGLAAGCEFNIVKDPNTDLDPSKINVVWTDGKGVQHLVQQDDTDGWSYDDPNNPTKVILNGQACGDVSSDLSASVQIVIGCPTDVH